MISTTRHLSRKRRVITRFHREARRRTMLVKVGELAHTSQTIKGMIFRICSERLTLVKWNATVKILTITNLI